MKKPFITFVLVLMLIFILNGCGLVLKTYYGIHQPKVETAKSLEKYMRKKKIVSNNIFTTVNQEAMKKHIGISRGIPEVLIFNKQGQGIVYKTPEQCNAFAFDVIVELDKQKTYPVNDTLSLDSVNVGLADLYGNPANIQIHDSADFLVVVYWARYTGRLNKNHVNIWEQDAQVNSKANIQVVKINLDMQAFWKDVSEIKVAY